MAAIPNQHARMNFRLGNEQKELIERAAAAAGQSVSDFAVGYLLKAARETLREVEVTRLSRRDSEIFLRMLGHTKPNAALRKAAARYKAWRG